MEGLRFIFDCLVLIIVTLPLAILLLIVALIEDIIGCINLLRKGR